ncbi:MAG TPA: hypothetical protein VGW39_14795 [Chthoniobacterales bacterium]|nr:hypothetical protein [Chthoniobacterales bacterium]
MTRHLVRRQDAEYSRIALLGVAGVCVVCVTQILTLPALDLCLKLALGGFSLGLPLLTGAGLMQEGLLEHPSITERAYWIAGIAMLTGYLCAVWGLLFLFWHFHWLFGLLFLVGSSVSFVAMFRLQALLGQPHKQGSGDENVQQPQKNVSESTSAGDH